MPRKPARNQPEHGHDHGQHDHEGQAQPTGGRGGHHAGMTFADHERSRLPQETIRRVAAIEASVVRKHAHLRNRIFEQFEPGAVSTGLLRPSLRDDVFTEFNSDAIKWALSRPRRNQASLSPEARQDFNDAVAAAIQAGTYGRLVDIHANGAHLMHGFMDAGIIAELRFLPWHRVFLYEAERLLQAYVSGVTIPYWDWASDHSLPAWLAGSSAVAEGPDTTRTLPTQAQIQTQVLNQT